MPDLEMEAPYEWNVEVDWTHGGGHAFRPDELLIRGDPSREFVENLIAGRGDSGVEMEDLTAELPQEIVSLLGTSTWWLAHGVRNARSVVEATRTAGQTAQPNHVFFADSCGCGCCSCPPHPSLANDLEGLLGDPLRANPLRANPLRANPLRANPLRANPLRANGPPTNGAIPSTAPATTPFALAAAGQQPRVVVFDTGIAVAPHASATIAAATISGDADAPDTLPVAGDGYLDPVAGHGTFIAGVIEQRCPGLDIFVRRVMEPTGDIDEATLAKAILDQLGQDLQSGASSSWPSTIFSLSMSGYVIAESAHLQQAIALAQAFDVLVVASAGNLGSCRPAYPAAYPGVISVGALGPYGPAPFTSYGPWVRACAPGVDVVSTFFTSFDGANPSINGVDPDAFSGWAMWSGTSFAVPAVVAAIGREMLATGSTASVAAAQVIDAPQLARIHNLGTIINL